MADITQSQVPSQFGIPLDSSQIIRSMILGGILWFAAAMLLRILGPMGIYDGVAPLVTYALVIPGTVPFVFLVQRLAGLGCDQIALGYSVATAAALILDGIAVAWFPTLYGTNAELVKGAAAAILWGAGVGLFLAFAINKAPRA